MATSMQRQLENSKARVSKLNDEVKELKKGRAELQRTVRGAVAGERAAKKALVQRDTTIARLEKQLEEGGITPFTKLSK